MTDISTLLQEAKPLYFARKKRRRQMRIAGLCCMGLLAAYLMPVSFHGNMQSTGEMEALYAYLYDPSYEEMQMGNIQNNSWDSFIPTDEYGLVAVV